VAASDTTQEWSLPAERTPPTVAELVDRIDEALATARASEAAVMTVGAAALDAAEQAKRAASLAERASATALASSGRRRPASRQAKPAAADPMDDFSARADMVAERLRRLQRLPLSA
jgi:hypothetical protein